MTKAPTEEELNKIHTDYWANFKKRSDKAMENKFARETAYDLTKADVKNQTSIHEMKSYEDRIIALQQADEEAERFIKLADDGDLLDFEKIPYGLTVLAVMAKMDEATQEKAYQIISKNNQRNARNKRPLGQHINKPKVHSRYLQWKKEPALYKRSADFIRAMQSEFGISKADTIRRWIKEWKTASLMIYTP